MRSIQLPRKLKKELKKSVLDKIVCKDWKPKEVRIDKVKKVNINLELIFIRTPHYRSVGVLSYRLL